jgi:Transposase domain (DUF772)
MVLQALEGLSDRDAAGALRDRISWKVAAGLALDDAGFDYSVLTYWRTRLRKGWHARPGTETVSSPLLAQLARSPSRTGRASFQPTARPTSSASTSSVRQPVRPDRRNR